MRAEDLIHQIKNREISMAQAEYSLRAHYNSGKILEKLRTLYEFLDEMAGVLDGQSESDEDLKIFSQFIAENGLSEA